MKENWPTKDKDIYAAQCIMEEYATQQETDSLGLFELVVNQEEKRMDFRLSAWVFMLAEHFKTIYGNTQGDFVTRRVLSYCIVRGETLH